MFGTKPKLFSLKNGNAEYTVEDTYSHRLSKKGDPGFLVSFPRPFFFNSLELLNEVELEIVKYTEDSIA